MNLQRKEKPMQNEQQYEQLMLQYNQIKNGAADIRRMIENEDFDNALTMIKSREELFLSCQCIRRYLELTPVQEKELNTLIDEIRALETENINILKRSMADVQLELIKTQKSEKIQQAYDMNKEQSGSIVNISE